ncbi:EamA-like transporter family protein [Lacrimispora xylanisolvens]|uniref:EamA-like transporter family protein n=1 Tax=Lacrimispora xylanisolvens TaxID=384636 RepID=A0A2S6HMM8_9FIRM|nr:DMT family transporter [Hungatella xylanolytica]PPK78754.1 EamA-like transporter family protein [Hungatella xylanolytica]
MKLKNNFHIYAMITIIFWSLAYVLTRLSLQYFTPFSLGFLRYFVASCTLIIVWVLTRMKLPQRKDLPYFILAGALGFFFYMIAFNLGQKTVTASTGSIVIATVPLLTAFIARFVYREKMSLVQWLALIIEFAGVAVLTLMNGILSFNIGLVWLFLAALALSLYNLLQRRLTKKYTALQTSAFSIFFGTILLAVFLPVSVRQITNAPPIQWVYLVILGVFSSAIAYVSWSKAFAKAEKTSQVSNYMFVTPFLTSLFGFLMADEIPELSTLVGGGIILFGVFVFNFGEKLWEVIKNRK